MEHFSRKLLTESGIHPDRFKLDWASAAQAPLYVQLITKFTERVKELGTLGSHDEKSLEEIKAKLEVARSAAASVKLRTQFAKFTEEMRRDKDYSPEHIDAKMSEKLKDAILHEMGKQ